MSLTTEDTEGTEGIKDGGAAFPSAVLFDQAIVEQGGMTLRDWFAGQAIAAIIQRDTEISKFELLDSRFEVAKEYDDDGQLIYACPQISDLCDDWEGWTEVAKSSYALADAMLRERNRKEESK